MNSRDLWIEIEEFIKESQKVCTTNLNEVFGIQETLNKLVQAYIVEKVCGLIGHKDPQSPKERDFLGLIEEYAKIPCPIEWKIVDMPILSKQPSGNEHVLTLKYKLVIITTVETICNFCNDRITKLSAIVEGQLLKVKDVSVLHKLYDFYKQLSGKDASDLQKIIKWSFHVKFVECRGDYYKDDYFEVIQTSVSEPETRFEAIVDSCNNCLERGTYLVPKVM